MNQVRRRQLKRLEIPGTARYLTFSCYRQLPLFSNDKIKDAFVNHLLFIRQKLSFQLLAWVVMPEHVHLLILPTDAVMPAILRGIKAPFARQVIQRWITLEAPILKQIIDAQNHPRFWQHGGGYDRNIESEEGIERAMDYIHANPIRRGLAHRPHEWKWSSAGWTG